MVLAINNVSTLFYLLVYHVSLVGFTFLDLQKPILNSPATLSSLLLYLIIYLTECTGTIF